MTPPAVRGASRLLRLHEVADRLAVSVPTVRRLIQRGELPRVKLLGAVRVRESDLVNLIETKSAW